MLRNNDFQTHDLPTSSTIKRRPRKKKNTIVDPESERQERELRAKIKAELAHQQVLRTEVEEDESQQYSQTVDNSFNLHVSDQTISTGNGLVNRMNNSMMGWGLPQSQSQSQMGGIWTQHHQQLNHYGFHLNQEGPAIDTGTKNPFAQQLLQMKQINQMKLYLEVQKQQLEQMKGQMDMLQQQRQTQLRPGQLDKNMEAGSLNEDIMSRLQDEQERLLRKSHMLDTMKQSLIQMNSPHHSSDKSNVNESLTNCNTPPQQFGPRSTSHAPVPQETILPLCMPTQDNPGLVSVQPSQRQQQDDTNHENISSQLAQPSYSPGHLNQEHVQLGNSASLPAQLNRNQYIPPQFNQSNNVTSQRIQKVDDQIEPLPYKQGVSFNQPLPFNNSSFLGTGVINTPVDSLDQFEGADSKCNDDNPKNTAGCSDSSSNGRNSKDEQETGSALMARGLSYTDVPLQNVVLQPIRENDTGGIERRNLSLSTTGSLSESDLAFHSVGNMSASFNNSSILGIGAIETAINSLEHFEEADSKFNNADPTNSDVWRNSSSAGGNGNANEQEAGNASITRGLSSTDNKAQSLHPIKENEEDFTKSLSSTFTQMSLLEGEFMWSNISGNGLNPEDLNELMMSMDSTTFNNLMKKSQNGDMNMSFKDFLDSNRSDSTPFKNLMKQSENRDMNISFKDLDSPDSETKPALSLGGTSVELDKSDFTSIGILSPTSSNISSVTPFGSVGDATSRPSLKPKRVSEDSKGRSFRSNRRLSTAMMSEVSQWTESNPFHDAANEASDEKPTDAEGE